MADNNKATQAPAQTGQSRFSRLRQSALLASAMAVPLPAVGQEAVLNEVRQPVAPVVTLAQATIPRADLDIGSAGKACVTYASPEVPRGALIMFDVNSGPNRPEIVPMMLTEIGLLPSMGQERYCDTIQNFRADAEQRSIELGRDIAQLVRQAAEATGKPELAQGVEILEDQDFARNLFPLTNTAESMFLRAARAYPAIWQDPVGQTIKDRGIASKKAAFIIESTENLLPILEAHFVDPEANPFPGLPAPQPQGIPINLNMDVDDKPGVWAAQNAVFDASVQAPLTLAQVTEPTQQTPGERGYACVTYASQEQAMGGIILASPHMSSYGSRPTEAPGQHPVTAGDASADGLQCETVDQFFGGIKERAEAFGRDIAQLTRRFADATGQDHIADGVERLEAEGFADDLETVSRLTREYFDRIVDAGQGMETAELQAIVPADELAEIMRRGSQGDVEMRLAHNIGEQLAKLEQRFGPSAPDGAQAEPIRWPSGPEAAVIREASLAPVQEDRHPQAGLAANDVAARPRSLTA